MWMTQEHNNRAKKTGSEETVTYDSIYVSSKGSLPMQLLLECILVHNSYQLHNSYQYIYGNYQEKQRNDHHEIRNSDFIQSGGREWGREVKASVGIIDIAL